MSDEIELLSEPNVASPSTTNDGPAAPGEAEDSRSERQSRQPVDWVFVVLAAAATLYALFAGLHTTADFDLGWQLASGRYILQHHAIPSTDVFSYTAAGKPWIYPPLGGIVLYLVFLAGGVAALSWLGALACATTAFLSTRQGGRVAATLAIIAAPSIAFRTVPRSELFTTVLFAAFLLILWWHYDARKSPLWLLPVLMPAWVNLHVGFIAGLAAVGAYIAAEICHFPFAEQNRAALQRLKMAAPWLAACVAATLANRWGWGIYRAILRQDSAMNLHSQFIGEWTPVHFSLASWLQAMSWRDPASGDWWILAVAAVAVIAALARKEIGPALIISVGAYEAVKHLRMQGLFAILVCIVGGTVLSHALKFGLSAPSARGEGSAWLQGSKFLKGSRQIRIAEGAMVALLIVFALARIADLVSNRYYLFSDQILLFGAGESWWFPENATQFLLRQNLPGNVFGDYNLGGFLTWKIGPKYPDYFDGRFLPFGDDVFARHSQLVSSPLDSPEWQQEADARNIQTAIFSTARFGGLSDFPLEEDCKSSKWAPVYLDGTAAIFVRKLAANAALIQRLGISCDAVAIERPGIASNRSGRRSQALRYEALMNRASVFYVLERDQEAYADIASAEAIFSGDPNMYLLKAQLAQAELKPSAAEREYRRSLTLRPTDSAWFSLAGLYAQQKNYPEALECLRESIAISDVAYDRYRALGKLYLLMNRPQEALQAFREAERRSPFENALASMGADFNARVAEGQAAAYQAMGDLNDAIAAQRAALSLTPQSASRWQVLAGMYTANGQSEEAATARQRSNSLQETSRGNSTQP